MNRTATLLMAVILVVGGISTVPMATAAQSGSSVAPTIDGSAYAHVDGHASDAARNVTAGERLAAAIGVGQAEFEGDIEQRSYGIEFARAATADAKADVVAERLDRIERRLDELEAEKEELDAARETGEISEGEYRARVTALAARTDSVGELANASEARANALPADVLERKGINVSAIQTLRTSAEALSGGEVAAIARSVAGDDVGQSIRQGPPEAVGVPDRAGAGNDATESGQDTREDAGDRHETPTDTDDGAGDDVAGDRGQDR